MLLTAAGGGAGYALGRRDEPAAETPTTTEAGPAKYRSRPDLRALPDVTITTQANGTTPGYIFLTPASGEGLWGPLMIDEKGSPVWFKKVPDPATVAIDFKVQQYQDKPVLVWWEGTIGGTGGQGVGQGEFVLSDTAYHEITRIRAASTAQADQHDFFITPQDTAIFWIYQSTPWDLSAQGGAADGVLYENVLQEIDIKTGRKLFEWKASDHIGLDESYSKPPTGDTAHLPWDYFHANSVGLDADNNLIISARHTSAVYKINRQTGALMWRLNGKKSDFKVDEKSVFAYQHDFRRRRDGSYSVFDNGAGLEVVHEQSRGLVFKVDETAKTVTFVKEFLHPEKLSAPTQGNFRELADGGSFIGWGQMPYFTEYAPDGTVRLDGHLPLDNQSYRAYKSEWTGDPTDQPALGLRVENGNTIVDASWNGTTAVATWRAKGGTQPDTVAQSVEAPRVGFETEITLPGTVEYVVAEALDADGKVLGTSSAIPVRI